MHPLIARFTQSSCKKNLPTLRPGDTVRIHERIREGNKTRLQVFEGLVLAVRGRADINASVVVRYVHKSTRVGVEKTFPLHLPSVEKIERVKSSKVRQARLYYLRARFGRAARLKGEAKNAADWFEATENEKPAAEQPADDAKNGASVEQTHARPSGSSTTGNAAAVEPSGQAPAEIADDDGSLESTAAS